MLKEFKEFAIKGNMIDMAVGIIIGASFGKIVTSLVNDIIMPPLGLLLGGVNFSDKTIILKATDGDSPAVSLNYGILINNIIDFLIVALAIFFVIRWLNRLKRKPPEEPVTPPTPTKEELLLTEIRDLLKNKS